jgi:hypothetical protein
MNEPEARGRKQHDADDDRDDQRRGHSGTGILTAAARVRRDEQENGHGSGIPVTAPGCTVTNEGHHSVTEDRAAPPPDAHGTPLRGSGRWGVRAVMTHDTPPLPGHLQVEVTGASAQGS